MNYSTSLKEAIVLAQPEWDKPDLLLEAHLDGPNNREAAHIVVLGLAYPRMAKPITWASSSVVAMVS